MATKDGGPRKRGVAELPDGPPDATGLTPRQVKVLACIKEAIETRGYPPSMREIGQAVGLTSTSSVSHQLKVLEENLVEIQGMCQDALEDAVLMGCDEIQVREVLRALADSLDKPFAD